MTFFNKKTEVMQIEMTPYGRYLYSIGKFKPHSYEFVDDDVYITCLDLARFKKPHTAES